MDNAQIPALALGQKFVLFFFFFTVSYPNGTLKINDANGVRPLPIGLLISRKPSNLDRMGPNSVWQEKPAKEI